MPNSTSLDAASSSSDTAQSSQATGSNVESQATGITNISSPSTTASNVLVRDEPDCLVDLLVDAISRPRISDNDSYTTAGNDDPPSYSRVVPILNGKDQSEEVSNFIKFISRID